MLIDRLKAKAHDLGFSMVGVVSAEPSRHLHAYKSWIANEMHGKMGYLARPDRQIRREDINVILPNVQSMICVGLDYQSLKLPADIANDPSRGRISNYAWGRDYHDIMTPRLKELGRWLSAEINDDVHCPAASSPRPMYPCNIPGGHCGALCCGCRNRASDRALSTL